MERLKTTAWYTCGSCKQVLHGENFYRLPNGCRTNECCKCYDKHIVQQQLYDADAQSPKAETMKHNIDKEELKQQKK